MSMSLKRFVIESAQQAINQPEVYQVGGHNGPYYDTETDIRNKCHWVVTFAACYRWTGDKIWHDEIQKNIDYLLADIELRQSGNFYHRKKDGKDKCNGLIGPAWSIEALVSACSVLNDSRIEKCAREVFLRHPWNGVEGLWNRVEIDGSVLSVDMTFNHQLWFAYAGSLIEDESGKTAVQQRVNGFLDNIDKNLTIKKGLIWHPIMRRLPSLHDKSFTSLFRDIKKHIKYNFSIAEHSRIRTKSIGYQSFNLLAFSGLRNAYPHHTFWQSNNFKMAVDYIYSDVFLKEVLDNPYGVPYNALGWEMPVVLSQFSDVVSVDAQKVLSDAQFWLNHQFERTFEYSTWMFMHNNPDPTTLTARLYEILQIPEYMLESLTVPVIAPTKKI